MCRAQDEECGAGARQASRARAPFLGQIDVAVGWARPTVVRRWWVWLNLTRSTSENEWKRRFRGETGKEREKDEGKKERKRKIFFSVFWVFKTRIYTLCDFSKRSFVFTYFKSYF